MSNPKRYDQGRIGMRLDENGPWVAWDDYAALEAENARLKERKQSVAHALSAAERERDAALAQLAAIQQAKGEEVEVVAVMYQHDETGLIGFVDTYQVEHGFFNMNSRLHRSADLMTVAQHQRITAAMAAEVERLSRDIDYVSENLEVAHAERMELRAELAAVKGQEAVAMLCEDASEAGSAEYFEIFRRIEPGTKLYAHPPASPDVDELVNELQHIAEKCSDPDTTDGLDAALSTWRQSTNS